MPEQIRQVIDTKSSAMPTKTYVRGTFLFSTDDGTAYEQKNRNRVQDEVLIEDRANLGGLKKQIQMKRQQITKKREKAKKQKQMLIPIRDTPVEPLPEPTMDNNKCERATQQQFEYFQTYISQKQKQRKFEQQERRKIQQFERQQEKFKKNQESEQRKGVSIVLEKQNQTGIIFNKNPNKKKGPSIKVVIKKKQAVNNKDLSNEDYKMQEENKQKIQKKQAQECEQARSKVKQPYKNDDKSPQNNKDEEFSAQKQEENRKRTKDFSKQQEQSHYQTKNKVKVIQQS